MTSSETGARHALDDLQLLKVQLLWGQEPRNIRPSHAQAQLGVARSGQTAKIDGPSALVRKLEEVIAGAPLSAAPETYPPCIDACHSLLTENCPLVQRESGLIYVFPPSLARVEVGAKLIRSDDRDVSALRSLNPGNWEADEWEELVDGRLGPWAMALVDGEVGSIAHTPRELLADAAEVGVWTQRTFRGRRLAAFVTAAWADILRPSGRHLFYSTHATNTASQRVASYLGLRPIGRVWGVGCADDVIEAVQSAEDPPLLVRFLNELLSWNGAGATAASEGEARHISVSRTLPGDAFLRLFPPTSTVTSRYFPTPADGGQARVSLHADSFDEVLAMALTAFRHAEADATSSTNEHR